MFRAIGMDVHRDFCEVAIVAGELPRELTEAPGRSTTSTTKTSRW